MGYAALAVLLVRPGGWLTERIAAVGRAAFTNYLGTSILVGAIFYGWGLGLFGSVSRAAIYLVAPLVWLIMLAWSKPWLDRYRYGPLEWLWRSLARWELQPMRKTRRRRRSLDPPEILVAGVSLAEAAGRGARLSSGLIALSNNSIVWLNSFLSSTTSLINSSGKLWVSMQKRAVLSISSASSASGSAPNWRASPFSVCAGKTKAVVFCSRIAASICATDFDAVLAEIAQDADESGPKLGAAALKMHPIDDVLIVVVQCPCSSAPDDRAWSHGATLSAKW